ncbi:NAD(P)-dependent oxidoreductase [Clostridium sp. DJ247]|uniref:NAD(P)-dependent oxidoreductase n=1 Tax=Clostridium sp. DJ247 TaxID=2726188 RepID=UPI001625B2CA|nr:NAD(P)-dependent oxidoreductase [Clostridium sp. DJ247]MBC2580767.1 NAD(P)-dependent oxidoreductase [Clostridium sp. DJ247]
MYENNTEDILCSRIEYTMLSLVSNKIKILIVGGGRAAFIKAKTFVKRGCIVTVLSKEFIAEFHELEKNNNLELVYGQYEKSYMLDKHIVVIATNCENTNQSIRSHCDEIAKLYVDCTIPDKGLCITPCQRESNNVFFGLHTLKGNPKMSVFLADKIDIELKKYKDFIEFTSSIRNKLRGYRDSKEILNFICSDDFYFFYIKGKHKTVLELFYDETVLESIALKSWDGD